jgi:hypothetical protein
MAMTNKDLSKIQAENSKSATFQIMKEAFDARKKKRGVVGRTQYPPFMFPSTKMKRGGATKMGMGGSCGKVILGKNLR